MAGINTGSFFSRLGQQMPGMINSLAQNYGGDMSGFARGSSALLNRNPKAPKTPKVTSGIPEGQMPGTPMPIPSMPIIKSGPINTAPSSMPFDMPTREIGIPGGNFFRGGGLWNPNAPKLDPMTGQYSTPSNTSLGGLFGAYNRIRF